MAHEAPIGWREMSIGDFAKPVSTKNNSSTDIPVLSMTKYDGFVCSEEYFSKRVYSTNTSKYKIVRKGQFAYATIHLDEGSIDYLRDFDEGLVSPMYTVFEVNEDIVFRPFLHSLLKRKALLGHFNTLANGGVNRRKSISFRNLSDAKILIPPIPEQKKIAEVLSSVDEAIVATKPVIDQTKQVKKGLLQTLLTKGIGHTKFKQTELGEIPESWEVVDVGSLADVIDPQPDHRTPPVFQGGVPYVGMGDIDKNGVIDFENAREVHPDVLVKQKAGFDIHPKAFIFGKIGTIGNPTYLPNVERFCLSANVILITSKCPIYSDFLFHALQSKKVESQIFKQINTTSQPALGIKKVRLFKIARPSDLDEMKAITDILSDFDHAINSSKEKLEQLQTLKYGLMSDLLTGRKRVEVPDA